VTCYARRSGVRTPVGDEIFRTHPEAHLVLHTVCTRPLSRGRATETWCWPPTKFWRRGWVWVELYCTWHVTVRPVSIHWKLNTTTPVSVWTVEWIVGGEWWIYVVLFPPLLHRMFVIISTVYCKLITIHYNKHVHSICISYIYISPNLFSFYSVCFTYNFKGMIPFHKTSA
jgi:hypothetical protein